jgi:hypothetical protein
MAGYGRLALSSWSTSVPTRHNAPSGFVMSTTRVGLPLTSWLVDLSRTTPRLAALIQTFAGAVLPDDLAAFEVLAAADGIDPERLGTFGFSGGGGRSLLLAALDHRVAACAVSCMMATFGSLVPGELDTHSWLLHIPGLWSLMDWPDLTALGRAQFLVRTAPRSRCDPAQSGSVGRRVGPAVPNELIDAVEEMLVCLALQIERSCAEGRRVDPGPRFGGNYGALVEVCG